MQVRKRPLNKKELAKNEEDIIDTYSNSLTVHETKLKVSLSGNTNQTFKLFQCCVRLVDVMLKVAHAPRNSSVGLLLYLIFLSFALGESEMLSFCI